MTAPKPNQIVRTEILPPETRDVRIRMPEGTPLGVAFLGRMRFAAIRSVIESYELTLRAMTVAKDAETELKGSIIRNAVVDEQLRNLDDIRDAEAERIRGEAELAKLRRKLDRLELEAKIAEKEGQLARVKGKYSSDEPSNSSDHWTELVADLNRMPGIAQAIVVTRKAVIKKFGGEENLTDADRQFIEQIDAISNATVRQRFEERGT
jgi:hypothetical protein